MNRSQIIILMAIAVVVLGWALYLGTPTVLPHGGVKPLSSEEFESEAGPYPDLDSQRDLVGISPSPTENPFIEGPCLKEFRRTGDFQEFVLCSKGRDPFNRADLVAGFRAAWEKAGKTQDAFQILFETARSELIPDDVVFLWSQSRLFSRADVQIAHFVDLYWTGMPPRNYLEMDAIKKHLESVLWGKAGFAGEARGLLAGLGSVDTPEFKTYALQLLDDVLVNSLSGESTREERKSPVFAAFRLFDDPVMAVNFLTDRYWWATADDVKTILNRVSFQTRVKLVPLAEFSGALEGMASLHSEIWSELKNSGFAGTDFSEEERVFLGDL